MYDPGEKVVCVNGKFDPIHKAIYKNLPIEGEVYTVRESSLGRVRTGGKDSGCSFRVLLVEIVNGPDPYMNPDTAEELGFRSDRFAPMISEEQEAEAEMAEPTFH
jgi:hypothetical protein